MVTPIEFWEKLDYCRKGRTWSNTSSEIEIKYNTLMFQKTNYKFPTFDVALRLCYSFNVELSWLMNVEQSVYTEDYRILRYVDTENKTLGHIYWCIIDEYRKEHVYTWKMISSEVKIPNTTLATAKSEERTLPIDVTVKILLMLNIPINAFAELFYSNEKIMETMPDTPSENVVLRNEIKRLLGEINDVEMLRDIKKYIMLIVNNPYFK